MAKDGGRDGEVMGPAELKPLLVLSKRQPISCAIGLTKDKQGVILLHKRTKPRKLMAELIRQGKGGGLDLERASIRFGRANVDGSNDSSTVHFTVNKTSPDALRVKMIEKLRPAGFQRCEIVVDAELETEGDEDEPEDAEEGTSATQSAHHGVNGAGPPASAALADTPAPIAPRLEAEAPQNTDPTAEGGANGQGTGAQPDAAALKATLRGLSEQIRPVLAADPSRAAALVKLATGARDSLARGDLNAARASIDALRRQLQADGDGSSPKPSSALLAPALFAGAPADAAVTGAAASPAAVAAVGEGVAEAAGTVVLRFALGAMSFIATLVIPTNTQRSSHGAAVDGRPEMAGTVTTAPGSRSGQVTIRLHGQNGQPDRELGTFVMDPDGTLTDRGQGIVLGSAGAGGIHLTPEGEKELLRRAGEGPDPILGTQPPSPAPSAPQQAGLGYETRDQEEADLAASLAGQGKSGQEIQAALDEHRRNARSAGSQSGSGTGASSRPQTGVSAARYGRTETEYEILAKDPAHGGRSNAKNEQERLVGLELEQRGAVPGKLTRDPSGAAEFIDGTGQKWDVKGFNSSFKPSKGGFNLQVDAGKIDKSLKQGENVMVDTSRMAPPDVTALKTEGETRGWGNKVIYWP